MCVESDDSSARQQRVDELIAAYLAAVDAGRAPDPSQLIAKHSDLGEELAAFFRDQEQLERMAESLRATAAMPPPLGNHPALAASDESSVTVHTPVSLENRAFIWSCRLSNRPSGQKCKELGKHRKTKFLRQQKPREY